MPKNEDDGNYEKGKFVARNWNKKTNQDLKKMAPQMKSRYLAYEEPPKDIVEAQAASKKRVVEEKKKVRSADDDFPEDEVVEKDKHEKLIGQLKAAEARNRIRIMRMRYEANRGQEINHLISCQPTARKAVRLQALIPIKSEDRTSGDKLDKISRARVETLLEDNLGLTTLRT